MFNPNLIHFKGPISRESPEYKACKNAYDLIHSKMFQEFLEPFLKKESEPVIAKPLISQEEIAQQNIQAAKAEEAAFILGKIHRLAKEFTSIKVKE